MGLVLWEKQGEHSLHYIIDTRATSKIESLSNLFEKTTLKYLGGLKEKFGNVEALIRFLELQGDVEKVEVEVPESLEAKIPEQRYYDWKKGTMTSHFGVGYRLDGELHPVGGRPVTGTYRVETRELVFGTDGNDDEDQWTTEQITIYNQNLVEESVEENRIILLSKKEPLEILKECLPENVTSIALEKVSLSLEK